MPEHITSDKVRKQIKQDGFSAGKKAIEEATKTLTDRGFDRDEILPIIREGVAESAK